MLDLFRVMLSSDSRALMRSFSFLATLGFMVSCSWAWWWHRLNIRIKDSRAEKESAEDVGMHCGTRNTPCLATTPGDGWFQTMIHRQGTECASQCVCVWCGVVEVWTLGSSQSRFTWGDVEQPPLLICAGGVYTIFISFPMCDERDAYLAGWLIVCRCVRMCERVSACVVPAPAASASPQHPWGSPG